ncbi:HET domain-containing protein [Apiospora saccharicola]
MSNPDTCFLCKRELNALKPGRYLEKFPLSELISGPQHGCRTCKFRKQAVNCITTDQNTLVVFVDKQKRFRIGRKWYEIFQIQDPNAQYDDNFAGIAKGNLLSESTSSDESFQTMKRWIQDCVQTHPDCPKGGQFFPKRLVDVRRNRAVLRENADMASYACLSHFWGPNQSPIRTTIDTIQDFKAEIPWDQLSNTFQDAVDIYRRLDISYIWIDSLCIIQEGDDFADWKEQSIDMGRIYANAFITIAATKSKDGTGGCYVSRSPGHVNARPIQDGRIYVREQMPYFKLREGMPFFKLGRRHMLQAHLLKRGWVYQEMMLSPRVLHFCEQDISWNCHTTFKSESGSNDTFVNDAIKPPSDDDDKSYPTGMLLCRRDDTYLAGLWQNTFLWDLLWQTESVMEFNGEQLAERPKEWCGPSWSWSWASVKSCVDWVALLVAQARYRPLACTRLMSIQVDPDGSRYLGQFRRAQISFSGPMLATTLGKLETMTPDSQDWEAKLQIDEHLSIYRFAPDCIWPSSGSDAVPREREVLILPLMVGLTRPCNVLGPAIWRREGEDDNTYERIGLVYLSFILDFSDVASMLPPE